MLTLGNGHPIIIMHWGEGEENHDHDHPPNKWPALTNFKKS